MDEDFPIDPSELNPTVTLPDLLPVSTSSSAESVKEASLQLINTQIAYVHAGWGSVRTIRDIALLGRTTIESIKARYDILGLPYGNKDKGPSWSKLDPLD
jgi:hypothetical protein